MEGEPEPGPFRRAVQQSPGLPADQAVDRVAVLGVGQRQLQDVFRELVAAVADPVRPGQQQLAAPTGAHLGGGEAVQQLTTAGRVLAEGGADLGDQGALVAQLERVLLTGREGLAHLNR